MNHGLIIVVIILISLFIVAQREPYDQKVSNFMIDPEKKERNIRRDVIKKSWKDIKKISIWI